MANTNCFLDYAGLELFWSKVKDVIENNELVTANAITNLDTRIDNLESTKSDIGHTHDDRYYTESEINDLLNTKSNTNHTHTFASLTSKPTTISGYGITDALKIDGSNGTAAGVSALINKLSAGSSDPTDADYYICQYAGGGTTTTSYHRRPMSAMWNWIKAKTDTLYPTKSGSGATGTWGINITGNAATATKIGTSTVGSSIMPVYINQGTPTAISSFPEANLSWGGKNFAAGFGPIDAAMISDLGACRSMFAKAEGITVQYSRDGGATWVDYGCTDTQKTALFSVGQGIVIGGTTETGIDKSNYKSRVIVTTNLAGIYTSLNKIAIYVSTSGSTGSNVTIDARKKANVDASNDTWVTLADRVTLAGNSGWNIINIPSTTTYGNRSDQYQQIRFTFGVTSHASTVTYPGLSVSRIKMFGGVGWTTPSNMARNGHLYTYDASQNATFPAAITSTMFKKSGGTSSQFLKADGSVDSNTYSKSGHTHDDRYYTESEINDLLANKSNTGHTHTKSQITDFAHTHDDRYYTESEMDTKLSTKSDTGHTHDDRYYTESEIDTKLATKSNTGHTHDFASLTSKPTTLAGYGITETDGYLNKISKSGNTLTITPKGGTAFTFTNTPLVSITYSELKSLRDAGNLVPGQQYRITDYTCTTTQANTRSAGHVFDIIVTADSTTTLNEAARAVQHVGDTYFNKCDLNAWKIWYCLDNDNVRFDWADTSSTGRGVIYRMIDEHNNDCPYDFKNIQYNGSWGYWAYTFNWFKDLSDSTCEDLSVDAHRNSDGGDSYAYGNIIKPHDGSISPGNYGFPLKLNACVFLNTESNDEGVFYICSNNTFGNDCYSNTFGNDCYSNTFGNNCHNNTFGDSSCQFNIFGDNCYDNTFVFSCNSNTFGNNCYSNTFGNSCNNNTFGNYCYSNTFGEMCYYNTFGNSCHNNTFGDNCDSNTFGKSFCANTFGDYCYYNTFGNSCSDIKFVTAASGSTAAHYCGYNKFDNGISNVKLYNAATASSTQQVQYYHIVAGVKDTSISVDRGRTYETKVAKNSNGELKIYCEADLIA